MLRLRREEEERQREEEEQRKREEEEDRMMREGEGGLPTLEDMEKMQFLSTQSAHTCT